MQQQLHATGLSSPRGQSISGCIGKQKPFRNPDILYAVMIRFYPSPIMVQGVYGSFFASFLFSIQNSAGSEQGLLVERRTGLRVCIVFPRLDTVKGWGVWGGVSGLRFKPSFMPPHNHLSLLQRNTRFSKVLNTQPPQHILALQLLGSNSSYQPLPPSPENLFLLDSS